MHILVTCGIVAVLSLADASALQMVGAVALWFLFSMWWGSTGNLLASAQPFLPNAVHRVLPKPDPVRKNPLPLHRQLFPKTVWPLKCKTCTRASFSDVPKQWKCTYCIRAGRGDKDVDLWEDKHAVPVCRICCQSLIRLIRPPHRCRCCGRVVCGSCAWEYKPVPSLLFLSPVRVCKECSTLLKAEATSWIGFQYSKLWRVDKWETLPASEATVAEVQQLVVATCNRATLGSGRDMRVNASPYNHLKVVDVWRVKNPHLWAGYQAVRRCMKASPCDVHPPDEHKLIARLSPLSEVRKLFDDEGPLDEDVNELLLWHGTRAEIVQQITGSGFNEQYSKESGLYGPGVYFADMCSKSDQYTTPDSRKRHYLLLCRVSMGFVQGISTPLTSRSQRRDCYDSLVGQSNVAGTYREYVVYDGMYAFPQFVVAYERVLAT